MVNKFINYFIKLSFVDFSRKVYLKIYNLLNLVIFIRKLNALIHLKRFNVNIGTNVRFIGQIFNIHVGKNVNIYPGVIFEFDENAKLVIGDNCLFSYGVIISCKKSISIGQDVQVGEYTSIRDSTHSYKDHSIPMKYAKDLSSEIIIGDNVWIGRGCIIMPGTIIEEGVVVGANSVVKGLLERNKIYGGNPVKFLKSRII